MEMIIRRKLLITYLYYHTMMPILPSMLLRKEQLELSTTVELRLSGNISEALYLSTMYDYTVDICKRNEMNSPLFIRGIINKMPITIGIN